MGMLYEYDLIDQVTMFGAEAITEGLVNEIERWGYGDEHSD